MGLAVKFEKPSSYPCRALPALSGMLTPVFVCLGFRRTRLSFSSLSSRRCSQSQYFLGKKASEAWEPLSPLRRKFSLPSLGIKVKRKQWERDFHADTEANVCYEY